MATFGLNTVDVPGVYNGTGYHRELIIYLDEVNGDDSRSVEQASNENTPWKTLTKLFLHVFDRGSTSETNGIALLNQPSLTVILKTGKYAFTVTPVTIAALGWNVFPPIGFMENRPPEKQWAINWDLGNGMWNATQRTIRFVGQGDVWIYNASSSPQSAIMPMPHGVYRNSGYPSYLQILSMMRYMFYNVKLYARNGSMFASKFDVHKELYRSYNSSEANGSRSLHFVNCQLLWDDTADSIGSMVYDFNESIYPNTPAFGEGARYIHVSAINTIFVNLLMFWRSLAMKNNNDQTVAANSFQVLIPANGDLVDHVPSLWEGAAGVGSNSRSLRTNYAGYWRPSFIKHCIFIMRRMNPSVTTLLWDHTGVEIGLPGIGGFSAELAWFGAYQIAFQTWAGPGVAGAPNIGCRHGFSDSQTMVDVSQFPLIRLTDTFLGDPLTRPDGIFQGPFSFNLTESEQTFEQAQSDDLTTLTNWDEMLGSYNGGAPTIVPGVGGTVITVPNITGTPSRVGLNYAAIHRKYRGNFDVTFRISNLSNTGIDDYTDYTHSNAFNVAGVGLGIYHGETPVFALPADGQTDGYPLYKLNGSTVTPQWARWDKWDPSIGNNVTVQNRGVTTVHWRELQNCGIINAHIRGKGLFWNIMDYQQEFLMRLVKMGSWVLSLFSLDNGVTWKSLSMGSLAGIAPNWDPGMNISDEVSLVLWGYNMRNVGTLSFTATDFTFKRLPFNMPMNDFNTGGPGFNIPRIQRFGLSNFLYDTHTWDHWINDTTFTNGSFRVNEYNMIEPTSNDGCRVLSPVYRVNYPTTLRRMFLQYIEESTSPVKFSKLEYRTALTHFEQDDAVIPWTEVTANSSISMTLNSHIQLRITFEP